MTTTTETTLAPGAEAEAAPPPLPDYLVDTYTWAYLRPASLMLLDNPVVVSSILWGNFQRLMRTACGEFLAGQKVLQAACVYGSFSDALARAVGSDGRLEVVDIAPLQVENCRRKLQGRPWVRVRLADAAAPGGGPYDGVCCFFLLHELPDGHKRSVVDGLLDSVRPGGRVVFVDYHQPESWHPLRGLMNVGWRRLEPFAFGLVDTEIQGLASNGDAFVWRKETYFGGLYQKVVAQRRPPA